MAGTGPGQRGDAIGPWRALPPQTRQMAPTRCKTLPVIQYRQLSRFAERALPVGILALAAVSVPVMMLRPEGMTRLHTLQQELTHVRAANADLTSDVGALRAEVRGLRDDPKAVEKIARDQLGLVRKSEIVFQFGKPR